MRVQLCLLEQGQAGRHLFQSSVVAFFTLLCMWEKLAYLRSLTMGDVAMGGDAQVSAPHRMTNHVAAHVSMQLATGSPFVRPKSHERCCTVVMKHHNLTKY